MDQGVTGGAPSPPVARRTRRRGVTGRGLAIDLTLLGVIGVLLVAAAWAAVGSLYAQFYSPTAFATRYLAMLSDGRAAEALAIPGVAVDSASLESAGLPGTASEALLRRAALAELTDIHAVSEEPTEGGATRVTVAYSAGPYPGETSFLVESNGWIGVTPTWRFAQSPLAVIDLTVAGSMQFTVNGFEIDKRQVSVDGVDADPLAAVPLLVFSPGVYSVSVDTPIAHTPGVAVLSDAPEAGIPVDLQAQPTTEFIGVVQQRVDEFLAQCATQQVLQPAGCPFGLTVRNRIVEPPVWSIAQNPTVDVVPNGADWKIPPTDAVAHIDVDIQSLFDGKITQVSEDVPFQLTGDITVLADGTASIRVSGIDPE